MTNLTTLQKVIAPYQKLSKSRFWLELVALAGLGWGALFASGARIPFSGFSVFSWCVALLAIYRGQTFIHEVSHFRNRLPGFELAYDLFFGFPNAYPSYIYDTHRWHHSVSRFGTTEDPEYLPMAGFSAARIFMRPFVFSALLLIYHWVRFGFLPVFYFFLPDAILMRIYQRSSTLVMNEGYVRPISDWRAEKRRMIFQDGMCSLYRIAILAILCLSHGGAFRTFALWNALMYCASVMNMLRAQTAHRYERPFGQRTKEEQFAESISIEPKWYNEIWAPLGLSLHSIHHLAPAIPYYNLRKAHQALLSHENLARPYVETLQPSGVKALVHLVKCCAKRMRG